MLENKNIHNLVCKKFGKGVIKLIVDRINQGSNVISTPSISCDNELDSVSKNAVFTSSEFTMILGTGEHDKTDWILYSSDSEIWSSKNDTVNKTSITNLPLEVSTNYVLKVRYHDSLNDIWSNYGSLEFRTANSFSDINTNIDPNVKTNGIHFIGCSNDKGETASNINFFELADTSGYKPDASNFEVVINDETTEQSLYSLTFSDGDDVLIRSKNGTKFPWFNVLKDLNDIKDLETKDSSNIYNANYKNFFSEIVEPLPILWKTETEQVTDFTGCFACCFFLKAIPNELFDNNIKCTKFEGCFMFCASQFKQIPENLFLNHPDVIDFSYCFRYCTSLTSIPQNLFANTTNTTNFSGCFSGCSSLTSIPENLFANNINVLNFSGCFMESDITSIPEELFVNNVNVTNFLGCFAMCDKLTNVPISLFEKNINATDFSACFLECRSLQPNVRIGSPNVTNSSGFAFNCPIPGTIYVPKDSTTATTFKNDATANVNVIEE